MGEEDPRGGDGMPVGGGSARGGVGQAWCEGGETVIREGLQEGQEGPLRPHWPSFPVGGG